jgi:hypothetical protein
MVGEHNLKLQKNRVKSTRTMKEKLEREFLDQQRHKAA